MMEHGAVIKLNLLWNSVGSCVYLAMQWVVTVLAVRLGDLPSAGQLALAMSFSNLFVSVAGFNMRSYQNTDLTQQIPNGVYISVRLCTCVASLLLCALFAILSRHALSDVLAITAFMLFRVSEAWADVYHAIAQRNWRLDICGRSMLLRGILLVFAFSLVLWATKTVTWAILAMAVVCLLEVFCYDRLAVGRLEEIAFLWRPATGLRLLKTCLPLMLSSFLGVALQMLPRLSLERQWGDEVLGIFASVNSPTLVVAMAAGFLYAPFTTLFAERQQAGDRKGFIRLGVAVAGATVLIGAVAIVCACFAGDWGLQLLYHDPQITTASYLLAPLLLTTTLSALATFVSFLLTALRQLRGIFYANLIGFIVCCFTMDPFIAAKATMGAAQSLVLAMGTQLVLLALMTVRELRRWS